jgi:hypothetical protein
MLLSKDSFYSGNVTTEAWLASLYAGNVTEAWLASLYAGKVTEAWLASLYAGNVTEAWLASLYEDNGSRLGRRRRSDCPGGAGKFGFNTYNLLTFLLMSFNQVQHIHFIIDLT